MNRHLELPPTEKGAALRLSEEHRVVYEKCGDDAYRFKCAYDPENEYEDDCIIVPLTSVYEDTETWRAGTAFVNVLSSSGDHGYKDGKQQTWHDMANAVGIPWICHEEKDGFYDCFSGQRMSGADYCCGSNVCGGHVVPGTVPHRLDVGDTVYIVPICTRHNSKNVPHIIPEPTPGNGNGFFMKMASTAKVIRLSGYMKKQSK